MFTIEQIKAAHSKVKSGADFPAYIGDLIQLGVTCYETFVSDGHSLYLGRNGYQTVSDAKYTQLSVSDMSKDHFQKELKAHQQGKTDYPTFCRMSADLGVEKWVVDTGKMTCIYYDKKGTELLKEIIPSV
jgi:uncharacterized protein YbcV (DUF1398 family)